MLKHITHCISMKNKTQQKIHDKKAVFQESCIIIREVSERLNQQIQPQAQLCDEACIDRVVTNAGWTPSRFGGGGRTGVRHTVARRLNVDQALKGAGPLGSGLAPLTVPQSLPGDHMFRFLQHCTYTYHAELQVCLKCCSNAVSL